MPHAKWDWLRSHTVLTRAPRRNQAQESWNMIRKAKALDCAALRCTPLAWQQWAITGADMQRQKAYWKAPAAQDPAQ
eukprot:14258895-Alexandrium_andersonii.AAC.1